MTKREEFRRKIESKLSEIKRLNSDITSLMDSLDEEESKSEIPIMRRIAIDSSRDPDPYGYHGLPLWHRLESMGFPHAGAVLR